MRFPSSGSEPVVLQVSVAPVVTPLLGVTLGVLTVGGLFDIVPEADAETVAPYPSVVDAVHVKVPPMGAMLVFNEILAPVPTCEPLIRQTYETVTDSPSGSLALAVQTTVLVGLGVLSESEGVVMDGVRLSTETEVALVSEPPLLSDTVAVH